MTDRGYPTMWEHVEALEAAGSLTRVDRPIDKNTELHPLVRWQYRGGVDEADRRAFLFTDVTSRTRDFEMPVVVGALAGTPEIYGRGLGVEPADVNACWERALENPIEPVEVPSDDAPVHDVVRAGDDLDADGAALEGLPVPISTPGWDNAPYTTMSAFVTHHPETGARNVGIYRAQVKNRRRAGMRTTTNWGKGIYRHWLAAKDRGEPLPAAVVLSGPPSVAYTGAQSLAYDVDELAVSGGLVDAPIRVTEGATVPVTVPADADLVVEGYISTDVLEPEGPYGESHGFINNPEYNNVMEVTAITHRSRPLLTSIVSQVTPSESSVIKKVALEPLFERHLREACNLNTVRSVTLHEPLTNLRKLIIVEVERGTSPSEVWRALEAVSTFRAAHGKIVIAVDDDIDPDNLDAVFWAMSYRSKPHEDVQVVEGRDVGHAPRREARGSGTDSMLLWDATLKHPMPPLSLPKKEYMERAREIWEDLDLPDLDPEMPWYGYSLGEWNEDLEREAQRAVEDRFFETGEELLDRQVDADEVELNTNVYGPEDYED